MDLGSLRSLALDLNFSAHGVPATVTRPAPDNAPLSTRVIWVTPITEVAPEGGGFQRREPIRIASFRRDEVPTVPRGTTFVAAAKMGDAEELTWLVEEIDQVNPDNTRVVVVEQP